MRTLSVAVISVVLGCVGCQPNGESPSIEEQCVRAKESQANSMRMFDSKECSALCQRAHMDAHNAATKWAAKVCK
jgi:hypothetical protein